jgi:hypothetical protein
MTAVFELCTFAMVPDGAKTVSVPPATTVVVLLDPSVTVALDGAGDGLFVSS